MCSGSTASTKEVCGQGFDSGLAATRVQRRRGLQLVSRLLHRVQCRHAASLTRTMYQGPLPHDILFLLLPGSATVLCYLMQPSLATPPTTHPCLHARPHLFATLPQKPEGRQDPHTRTHLR